MKENGKRKLRGNCRPSFSIAELIDSKFVQTEAYIDAQCKGSYKKNQDQKAITRIKWEKTKNKCKQGIA